MNGGGIEDRNERFSLLSEGEIRHRTACRHRMHCLKRGGEPGCRVVDCVGGRIFFVARAPRACRYCMSFGAGYYCKCPVRQELFCRYDI